MPLGRGVSDHIRAKQWLASGISTIAVAAALSIATPALAQSENAQLQGHVDGAPAGTQVVAVDTNTGQRSVGRVDAQGQLRHPRPQAVSSTPSASTGQYAADHDRSGRSDRYNGFHSDDGSYASGGAGGAIIVTGRRNRSAGPGADRRDQHHAGADRELAAEPAQLPELRALAPGVQVSPGGTRRSRRAPSAPSNVNVLLDGMSFKNPINHGGVFGQNFGDSVIPSRRSRSRNIRFRRRTSARRPVRPDRPFSRRSPRRAATNSTVQPSSNTSRRLSSRGRTSRRRRSPTTTASSSAAN